ncbi:Smad nuclear-interacting protein 1 [Geodia barretti]|uniref:Smad nuclear-interacting protein 1 n=1 Tax=Geodia barretti TaxID=519541 RepID=A0AA35WCU1_GEOBA|nr:Smad nuclear-interacting protein 1 [Geodia barretti]
MSRHRSRHHDTQERHRERSRSPQPRAASLEIHSSEKDKWRERHKRRESGGEEGRTRRREKRDEGIEKGEEKRRGRGHHGSEERRDGHKEEGREGDGLKREGGRRGEEEVRRKEEVERRREGEEGSRRNRDENRGRERRGQEEVENWTRASGIDRAGERDTLGSRRDEERRQKREQRTKEDEEATSYEFGGEGGREGSDRNNEEPGEMEEPSFALSGKLTAETNTYRGVVIKYSEPGEARQPTTRWRLYQFKGDEVLPTLYVHRQSAYLIGRDRRVVDLPVDHPSCSGQHAVLQYRLVTYEKNDGSVGKRVRPYLIDLESTNGTYINNQRIESARYWELKEQDMIKFGFSSREYIILHENSKDAATAVDATDDQP